MKLSVVIPARNEEGCIESTVRALHAKLAAEKIEHEILVLNDGSHDNTEKILESLCKEIDVLRYINRIKPHGFGLAVREGLEHFSGDAVAVYMADASDRPEDLITYWRTMQEQKVDCVFGSRFMRGGGTHDYPWIKLCLNRFANLFIQVLFGLRYNDITNAFKLYKRNVIDGCQPFLSPHYNLTVEIPLKAIVRGYTYAVVPNHWINRKTGISKLRIQEMGSRYLFIVLYCFIEKWLSRGDYKRRDLQKSTLLPIVRAPGEAPHAPAAKDAPKSEAKV